MLADQAIEQTQNINFLGVIIDSTLSLHDQIDVVSDRIS